MNVIEKAKRLRAKIESLAETMTDEEGLDYSDLFPSWQNGKAYTVGDRVRYEADLYRCIQAHTSQADWTPSAAVSLWVKIADPAIEWPEWVQPTGAHDAYKKGDKVTHNGEHYISNCDANVWEPGVYGWDKA